MEVVEPPVKQPAESERAPPLAVCRYCFEPQPPDAEPGEELIAPCACSGNGKWVHRACLTKWQRRQLRACDECEVCRTTWKFKLGVLDRECFVRSVRTNPRFPPVDDEACDEALQATLDGLMRPGSLILQTPSRAAQHRNLTREQNAIVEQVQTAAIHSQSTLSLFASMLTLQRAKHWLRGAYLIVSRGDGDATDGSDSIVAVNLARPFTPGPGEANPGSEALAEMAPLTDSLAPATAPLLIGGPCHQTQPLCLCEIPADAPMPVRGDVLTIPLTEAAAGAAADEYMPAAADAYAAIPPAAEGVGESAQRRRRVRVVAAEAAAAAAIVQACGGSANARVVVVQGCAIWSTAQLRAHTHLRPPPAAPPDRTSAAHLCARGRSLAHSPRAASRAPRCPVLVSRLLRALCSVRVQPSQVGPRGGRRRRHPLWTPPAALDDGG